jgi:hypothetical protein
MVNVDDPPFERNRPDQVDLRDDVEAAASASKVARQAAMDAVSAPVWSQPAPRHEKRAGAAFPRLVGEMEAAEFIGIPVATFRAWVGCGRLPSPLLDCGKYDLKAIDVALDRISGLDTPANALDAWRARGGRNARSA